MGHRVAFCGSAAVMAVILLTPVPAAAQAKTVAAKPAATTTKAWTASRTRDGQPDLQGVWTNSTVTPLERPADLGGKEFFASQQEAADYAKKTLAQISSERRDGGPEVDVGRSYNEFWRDRGTSLAGSLRTSLIIDPQDGKVPALTPEAQKRAAERAAYARQHTTDGPEDRSLWERCLTRGLPILPGPYNNDFQIVQTAGYVVILHEMIHDARVIPLDGRAHVPANIRQWMGDGRGHWEGDTLVIETTNFSDKTNFRGSGKNLHLVERFTRTSPDTIIYQFTADDPTTFTRPWTAEIPMSKAEGGVFEYACHEGNYALMDILAGARAEEKRAATDTRP